MIGFRLALLIVFYVPSDPHGLLIGASTAPNVINPRVIHQGTSVSTLFLQLTDSKAEPPRCEDGDTEARMGQGTLAPAHE